MAKKININSPEVWQPLCFAAATVERMYPNFVLFDEVSGGESAKVFRVALDLVWEFLITDQTKIDFVKQYDKLEEITPNPESFDFYGVWPALDACVALSTLLECCAGQDECKTGSFIRLSSATIKAYIDASDFEGDSNTHPLIDDHKAFCQELDRLLAAQDTKQSIVKSVKKLTSSLYISNIGLDLNA